MTTAYTNALRQQFERQEALELFVTEFSQWKAAGEAGEYLSYLFGKDSAYAKLPPGMITGQLRHVHLVPVLDKETLAAWDKAHHRGSRKVSDRALVYAEDTRGNFLLLFILTEPDAHAIAEMRTSEHKTLMRQFVQIAETWAFGGEIIA